MVVPVTTTKAIAPRDKPTRPTAVTAARVSAIATAVTNANPIEPVRPIAPRVAPATPTAASGTPTAIGTAIAAAKPPFPPLTGSCIIEDHECNLVN